MSYRLKLEWSYMYSFTNNFLIISNSIKIVLKGDLLLPKPSGLVWVSGGEPHAKKKGVSHQISIPDPYPSKQSVCQERK